MTHVIDVEDMASGDIGIIVGGSTHYVGRFVVWTYKVDVVDGFMRKAELVDLYDGSIWENALNNTFVQAMKVVVVMNMKEEFDYESLCNQILGRDVD